MSLIKAFATLKYVVLLNLNLHYLIFFGHLGQHRKHWSLLTPEENMFL